jgi:hypothetical protein
MLVAGEYDWDKNINKVVSPTNLPGEVFSEALSGMFRRAGGLV